MLTLSYGYKKPESGDKGGTVFPALEANIQRLNDHDHDGTDSAKLTSRSVTAVSATISNAGWVSLGGGNYRQIVTMPSGLSFDDYVPSFRLASGHPVNLSVEKVTTTTYYVYINDNSLTITVKYIS